MTARYRRGKTVFYFFH